MANEVSANGHIPPTTSPAELSPLSEADSLQSKVVIMTGLSNPALADDIAHAFDTIISPTKPTAVDHPVSLFDTSGERRIEIGTSVAGKDVLIVQPTAYNADEKVDINDAVMEAMLMIDAARIAGARRVILAAANYGYARQDRISLGHREANSAALLARLYAAAGADMIFTIDIHQPAIEGAFATASGGKQWKDLYGVRIFTPVLRREIDDPITILSPDAGGLKNATRYSDALGADIAFAHKRRDLSIPNHTVTSDIAGNIAGRHVVVIDDVAAGAGTLADAGNLASDKGAIDTHAVVTHAQLYGDKALERITNSSFTKVYVSDTIAHRRDVLENPKIMVVTAANMLAEVFYCVVTDQSISERLLTPKN